MPLIGPSGSIKLIQEVPFSWTWVLNQTTGADIDQPISPVNMANTVINVIESPTSCTNGTCECSFRITSPTNVRLNHICNFASGEATSARILAVEYKPGVLRSLQEIQRTADPQTIAEVNADKSIYIPLTFKGVGNPYFIPLGPLGAHFASSTSLEWKDSPRNITQYGMVAEFYK